MMRQDDGGRQGDDASKDKDSLPPGDPLAHSGAVAVAGARKRSTKRKEAPEKAADGESTKRAEKPRIVIFHNPKSGAQSHTEEQLVEVLRREGGSVSYCSTKDPDFPYVLSQPTDLIIAAGGDGTVGRILKELEQPDATVAILPLGTANNIARSLGVAGTLEEIIAGWRAGRTRWLDIGAAWGKWGRRGFVEAVGLGTLTQAIAGASDEGETIDERVRRGREEFRAAVKEAKPERVDIVLDGRPLAGEFLLVEIMNIPCVGSRLRLAPSADPGDGLLDVVYIAEQQRAGLLEWLKAPDESGPPVTVRRAKKVELVWGGTPLRLDDDIPETRDAVETTIELRHKAVKILLPQPASQDLASGSQELK